MIVPQGSILEALLFNFHLIDFFFKCDDFEIAWYANNTTPYSCADDMRSIITQLQSTARKLFAWFTNNHMKVNSGKCHILLSTKTSSICILKEYVLRLAPVKSFLES